jgi:DNA-binding response OmpR family regulator
MAKNTVLVVDDDHDIREVLTLTLSREGYDVLPASNGKVAFELLERQGEDLPGLIILDLTMREMSGAEFLSELHSKHADKWARIPVVVASAATKEATEGLPPVALFLRKPMELLDLLAVVERYCGPSPAMTLGEQPEQRSQKSS